MSSSFSGRKPGCARITSSGRVKYGSRPPGVDSEANPSYWNWASAWRLNTRCTACAQPDVVERLLLDGEDHTAVAAEVTAGVPDREVVLLLQLDAEAVRPDARRPIDLTRLEEAELDRVVRDDPVLDSVEVRPAGPPVVRVPDVASSDALLVRLGEERPGADQGPRGRSGRHRRTPMTSGETIAL